MRKVYLEGDEVFGSIKHAYDQISLRNTSASVSKLLVPQLACGILSDV